MAYWIKRIVLKTGEIVTEQELREEDTRHEGPPPVVGDIIDVECRGRRFLAKVIWGSWPGRPQPEEAVIPLRVAETGLDEQQTPLWMIRRSEGEPDRKIDLAPLNAGNSAV
jgi:hypothetical protein